MPAYNGPRNPNPKDGEAGIVIYGYVPSIALAAIGVATFGLVLAVHLFYFIRYKRTKIFEGLICLGCLMEMGGYIARLMSHSRPFLVATFVAQYFLIVCAPVAFAAALYLALSIIVQSRPANVDLVPFSPRKIVAIFVTIDIVTTILQIAGAALIGVSESALANNKPSSITPDQANDILLAGLAVQNAAFLFFIGILSRAILRSRHAGIVKPVRTTFLIIFATAMLILTRTLFRLGETAEGVFGYASTNEALFGVFEYTPVIIAIAMWAVIPFGKRMEKIVTADEGDAEKKTALV